MVKKLMRKQEIMIETILVIEVVALCIGIYLANQ